MPGQAGYYIQSHSDRKKNSKERLLPGLVVEDGAPAKRWRDRLFVGDDGVEVGFGVKLGFGRADEAFKTAEAVEFVPVADLCGVERSPEEIQGFVIRLQGNLEWAPILAAVRERKTRGIGETARRSVDDFGD